MEVTVGTFNLNNLFSRFNFRATVDELKGGLSVKYEFTDPVNFRLRTYRGKLIKKKDDKETERIRDRVLSMDVDVLAVQEVENIDILREFNRSHLGGLYPHQALVEGNDPRLIDVGVLSKLPLGVVTSHQHAVHPEAPTKKVFGRDLQEVEVWSANRTVRLFSLFNNHLKSHYGDDDGPDALLKNNTRRRRQAEAIAQIVESKMQSNSRFIILGDMNDPPDSGPLSPMVNAPALGLVNALANPQETRPPKQEKPGEEPTTTAWTYRHKEAGQPPEFHLYDQIWVSPALANTVEEAWIDRRTLHGGTGSDHDPAWVKLTL